MTVRRVFLPSSTFTGLGRAMNRRSLLDYLPDNELAEPVMDARQTAELLQRRLVELESKLAAAARPEPPLQSSVDHTFSSQIETILKRPQEQLPARRMPAPPEPQRLFRQRDQMEIQAPPFAAETASAREQQQAEFTKFVEAVHLIGRAANRFLQEPPRQAIAVREISGPSEDTKLLTSALRETLAAFQALTSDLVTAAAEIRRAADVPRIAVEPPPQPLHRLSPEEAELSRLQDDLASLRERLGAVTRRKA